MINLTVRLYEHVDRDLVELFSDYNVSSSIFLDALYADFKQIPLQFAMPKKRNGDCPRRKRFAFEINDEELADYISHITPGFRNEYVKTLLKGDIQLFREHIAFNKKPEKKPDITYIDFPRDILETDSRKLRRKGPKRTLYSLMKIENSYKVKESVADTKKIVESSAIEDDDPKSEALLIKTEIDDEKISEISTILDVSPKEEEVPLTTLTNTFGEKIEVTDEDEDKDEGSRMLDDFLKA